MRHDQPIDDFTAADYLELVRGLKGFWLNATSRRILLYFAAADRQGVWVQFTGRSKRNLRERLYQIRKLGWPVQNSTPYKEQTWRWIRSADLAPEHVGGLKQIDRYTPMTNVGIYRMDPQFLTVLRTFIGNYSTQPGSWLIDRWAKPRFRHPMRRLMRAFRFLPSQNRG